MKKVSSTASTTCALCSQESGLTWLLCGNCRTPENLAALLISYSDPASSSYSADGHSAFIAFGSADVLERLPYLSKKIASHPTLSGWWTYWYSWISTTPENAEFFQYLQKILPQCPQLVAESPKVESPSSPIAGQIAETLLTISSGVISQVSGEAGKTAQKLFRQGIRDGKGAVSEVFGGGAESLRKGADALIGGVEKKAKKSAGSFLKHAGNILSKIISRILHSVILKIWLLVILPVVAVVIGLMLLAYFLFK